VLAELNRCCGCWPKTTGALVAEVHARFLGHGLGRRRPYLAGRPPRDRGLWHCRLIEPNAWGASQIRASFWEALQRAGTEWS
jgi:hypothetical protein